MGDLRVLADYAVELYRRERHGSVKAGERADLMRQAVLRRKFTVALDLLGLDVGFGDHHLLFLERAFPHLSEQEQATSLQYAWQRLKGHRSLERALSLFRQAKTGLVS